MKKNGMPKSAVIPVFWSVLLLYGLSPSWLMTPVWAENSVEETLKIASEALGNNALDEAEQRFTRATNAPEANRHQRATAFAGRCAVRYKISLSTKNPGMIPQAISDCDRAIELKSDMQQAYRIRGVALLSAGHPDRASEDLNVAVALRPEDYLAFQNRALALAKLGRAQEAMTELDSAIRLKPDHPWSYYNRGRLHVTQGEYEAAIDDFIAFIRFKRDHEEVYRLRGQCRLLVGLPQQAVGDLYESLRLRPNNNPEAHFLRGVAFYMLERFVEAEQDLVLSLPMQSNNMENRLWLYLVRERLGKPGREVLTDPAFKKNPKQWPGALVAVFLGEMPPEKSLEAARQTEDPIEAQLRENLTLLLLGHWSQIKGRQDEAARWFGTVKNGSGREGPYFRTAQLSLQQMGAPYNTLSVAKTPRLSDKPTQQVSPTSTSQASKPESDILPQQAPSTTLKQTSKPDSETLSQQVPSTTLKQTSKPDSETLSQQAPSTTLKQTSKPDSETLSQQVPSTTLKQTSKPDSETLSQQVPSKTLKQTSKPDSETLSQQASPTPIKQTSKRDSDTLPRQLSPSPIQSSSSPEPEALPTTAGTPAETSGAHASDPARKPATAARRPALTPPSVDTPSSTVNPASVPTSTHSLRHGGTEQEKQGQFVFKVASYSNAKFANEAITQYASMGLPVFLEQSAAPNKTYQRIWIGPFNNRALAEAARERIATLPKHNPGEITQR
ncbi:MAG: tetratricopeptide repeat protein [Magnetococcus sp. YQC-5]